MLVLSDQQNKSLPYTAHHHINQKKVTNPHNYEAGQYLAFLLKDNSGSVLQACQINRTKADIKTNTTSQQTEEFKNYSGVYQP